MKAFVQMSMIVEVEDDPALEDMRASMELSGWNSLLSSMQTWGEENGVEFTEEVIDEAVLFYGVQAWPLPSHPEASS